MCFSGNLYWYFPSVIWFYADCLNKVVVFFYCEIFYLLSFVSGNNSDLCEPINSRTIISSKFMRPGLQSDMMQL
jgi:hypothetical protein